VDTKFLSRKALNFAAIAHKDQFRKGTGEPYLAHLARVVQLLGSSVSEKVIAAAWLHDILEDCDVDYDDLSAAFEQYPGISDLVACLTEPAKSVPWQDRKLVWTSNVCQRMDSSLIAVCDKLENTLSIQEDLARGLDIGTKLKCGILGYLQSNILLIESINRSFLRSLFQEAYVESGLDEQVVLNVRVQDLKQLTVEVFNMVESKETYVPHLMPLNAFLSSIAQYKREVQR
jgi:(p)ppGpp synthase/HD superfamily hydrolase